MYDNVEEMTENSFFDFHAKGLDYVCLKRSPELTIKAYFFDADSCGVANEVVNPHNHRYDFRTEVLSGRLTDYRYKVEDYVGKFDDPYQQFSWHTPLNGGTGFQWRRQCGLTVTNRNIISRGRSLLSRADMNHTIMVDRETVLLLYQFEDKIPEHWATNTYIKGWDKEPPSLDGLYRKPSVDEIRGRLSNLNQLGLFGVPSK